MDMPSAGVSEGRDAPTAAATQCPLIPDQLMIRMAYAGDARRRDGLSKAGTPRGEIGHVCAEEGSATANPEPVGIGGEAAAGDMTGILSFRIVMFHVKQDRGESRWGWIGSSLIHAALRSQPAHLSRGLLLDRHVGTAS